MFLSRHLFFLVLSAVVAYAHPLISDDLVIRGKALLPDADPFYAAPHNLSDYAPGAIIRSRAPPGPLALFSGKINVKGAWQVLYRTNGINLEPLASVTTIIVPHNADYGKFLSYQVEIDSPYNGCFPSITLQQSMVDITSLTSQYGLLWVMSALEKGWVVSVPDHDGPTATFGAGIVAGQVTLDNLRAALQSQSITGLQANAKTVIWGYSGGALAAEWALELHDQYAPELKISAAALGGVPANAPAALFGSINKGVAAGLAFNAIMGISNAYADFASLLKEHLLPNASAIYHTTKQCTIASGVEFAYKNIWDYIDIREKFLDHPTVQKILVENTMGNLGVSKVPTYIYHSTNDEILPFKNTQDLYNKYCAAGANIQFSKEALGEHGLVGVTGAAGALSYLMDRMDGKAVSTGCRSQTVVSSILDPRTIPVLGQAVFSIIAAFLGTPLGPR